MSTKVTDITSEGGAYTACLKFGVFVSEGADGVFESCSAPVG